jgi:predicted house-cleaning NTP pyrophosphatase (Maf/HAM1 superfamily)
MTLVLDSTSKKKLLLLKELALEMGVKVTEMSKKPVEKETEKDVISDLSKKVNKSMTKKLFAKFDIDYDSYNRQ